MGVCLDSCSKVQRPDCNSLSRKVGTPWVEVILINSSLEGIPSEKRKRHNFLPTANLVIIVLLHLIVSIGFLGEGGQRPQSSLRFVQRIHQIFIQRNDLA